MGLVPGNYVELVPGNHVSYNVLYNYTASDTGHISEASLSVSKVVYIIYDITFTMLYN